jgi:hypothetical protein
MCATQGQYNVRVPELKHYYGLSHLHYMNIWSPKKQDEKFNCMHDNPVQRGPVKHPGDWPWSRRGGEVLFLEWRFDLGHGQDGVTATHRGALQVSSFDVKLV